ncbi:MAG: hypothetical protein ACEQSD_08755 [Flavobacteriales bacterium]
MRVYIIIIRKTRGWQKESDRISLSQFQAIGKRSRHTVIAGLNELESLSLITKTDTEKGSVWTLNDSGASAKSAPVTGSENSALVQDLHQPSAKSAPVASAKSAHTKDTIKTTIQKTESSAPTVSKKSDSFVPDLTVLNDMLKAGMAKPVTQNQLEQVLIEFIPWYETKHMTYNQRMAKLFAWIKKDQGAVSNNRSLNQTLQSSAAEPEFVKPSAPVKRGPTPEQLAEQKRQADEFLANMRNGGAA